MVLVLQAAALVGVSPICLFLRRSRLNLAAWSGSLLETCLLLVVIEPSKEYATMIFSHTSVRLPVSMLQTTCASLLLLGHH